MAIYVSMYKMGGSAKKVTKVAAPAAGAFMSKSPVGVAAGYAVNKMKEDDRKKKREEDAAKKAALVEENKQKYGWGSLQELTEARKKKAASLEERDEEEAGGISSLIGKNKTLG